MTRKNTHITFDMLRERFNKPLAEVATELGVCMTFIKKACRKNGIKRWPFRKVQAIRNRELRVERAGIAESVESEAGASTVAPRVIPTIPLGATASQHSNPFLEAARQGTPLIQVLPMNGSTAFGPSTSTDCSFSSEAASREQQPVPKRPRTSFSGSSDPSEGPQVVQAVPVALPPYAGCSATQQMSKGSSILAACSDTPVLRAQSPIISDSVYSGPSGSEATMHSSHTTELDESEDSVLPPSIASMFGESEELPPFVYSSWEAAPQLGKRSIDDVFTSPSILGTSLLGLDAPELDMFATMVPGRVPYEVPCEVRPLAGDGFEVDSNGTIIGAISAPRVTDAPWGSSRVGGVVYIN